MSLKSSRLLLRKVKTALRYGLETCDLSWRQVWCQSRLSRGEYPDNERAISCSWAAGRGEGEQSEEEQTHWDSHYKEVVLFQIIILLSSSPM